MLSQLTLLPKILLGEWSTAGGRHCTLFSLEYRASNGSPNCFSLAIWHKGGSKRNTHGHQAGDPREESASSIRYRKYLLFFHHKKNRKQNNRSLWKHAQSSRATNTLCWSLTDLIFHHQQNPSFWSEIPAVFFLRAGSISKNSAYQTESWQIGGWRSTSAPTHSPSECSWASITCIGPEADGGWGPDSAVCRRAWWVAWPSPADANPRQVQTAWDGMGGGAGQG